jgi:hypothetical protein
MAAFVLVHDSWAGGWPWERLRPKLADAGHRVLIPTLTSLAERHLLGQLLPLAPGITAGESSHAGVEQ